MRQRTEKRPCSGLFVLHTPRLSMLRSCVPLRRYLTLFPALVGILCRSDFTEPAACRVFVLWRDQRVWFHGAAPEAGSEVCGDVIAVFLSLWQFT